MDNVISKNNTNKNRMFFIVSIAVFLLLIMARNVLGVRVPALLYLIYIAGIAIFCDRTELGALCVTFIPFYSSFQYKYAILLCIIIYAIKYGKDIKFNFSLIILVIMIIWELLHGFKYYINFFETLRGFSELLLFVFFLNISYKDFDFKFICRVFVWTSIGIMTLLLLQLLIKINFDFEKLFTGSAAYRFGNLEDSAEQYGGTFNPNGLGFICNLALTGILQLIYFKQNNIFDFFSIAILVFFGVLTLSRTFLICLVFIITLYVFSGKISIKKRMKRLFLLVIIITLFTALVITLVPTVLEGFKKRFNEEDISNGRMSLFLFYGKHILSSFEYFFFGIGMQNIIGKLSSVYPSIYLVPHNGIIESIVVWGLPGLIFLFFILFAPIYFSNKKFKLINLMPIILIFIDMQAGQFLRSGQMILAMLYSYFYIIYYSKEK